jgi:hypothetical protein
MYCTCVFVRVYMCARCKVIKTPLFTAMYTVLFGISSPPYRHKVHIIIEVSFNKHFDANSSQHRYVLNTITNAPYRKRKYVLYHSCTVPSCDM